MPRVFVVQESPGKNFISAQSFGKIEIIMPPNRQITFSTGPAVRHIRDKLRNFTDDDFIVAIGDPVAIAISCAVASEVNNGKFKILKWDRQNTTYYAVEVNLHEEREKVL